ncbi:MAG: histidine phosphatase family protein [Patescibacteria group bacterium]|nr:histidine phosphatase family protein [Patescibacteria group bacterium]
MIVYFVRHGESELNAKRVHQDGNAKLSEAGVEQANKLAERLISLPIDTILSSSFERAKQTAEIISQKINIPVQMNSLLVEIKRPTEIEGRGINEPEVVEIKTKIRDNWNNLDFRHSDEETFYEFRDRAKKVMGEIKSLNSEHTLIVTHGDLIGMIICVLTFGDELSPKEFLSLRNLFALSNTGITVCEYKDDKWKLISWNDVSHLPI